MQKLIHTTHDASGTDYQLYAEVNSTPTGTYKQLKFYSVWSGAKNPEGKQVKFEAFLNADDIANLKSLLENAT